MNKELLYNQTIIATKTPKCYSVWHHRYWIILKGYGNKENELELCNKLLEKDQRNFHCWGYRLKIVKMLGDSQKEIELNYAVEKLSKNLSNYSAMHYKIYYYNMLKKDTIEDEVNVIENAVYTDPYDQSYWLYLKWLINYVSRNYNEKLDFIYDKTIEICEDLMSEEENCHWPVYLLYYVYKQKYNSSKQSELKDKCVEYLSKLVKIDNLHKQMYEDLIQNMNKE